MSACSPQFQADHQGKFGGMSRLNRTGHMPDPHKFNLAEWLVPPILLPIILGLVVAGAVIIQR